MLFRREGCTLHLMAALHLLCHHYLLAGRYDQAMDCARQMVRREPWDEAAHQQLMRAMALAGRRHDALRQFAVCRRQLLSELHIEPGAATVSLFEHIRDGLFPDHPTDSSARTAPAASIRLPAGMAGALLGGAEMAASAAPVFALDL